MRQSGAGSEQTALLRPGQDMLRHMGSGDWAAATKARPIVDVNAGEQHIV
jgi:hypothetical protein